MRILDYLVVLLSTAFLVVNQICLKYWLTERNIVVWPINLYFLKGIFSIEILIAIISLVISGIIWLILLKRINFSVLYPMISLSYVFGILAAVFVFREHATVMRRAGLGLIMIGVFMVPK